MHRGMLLSLVTFACAAPPAARADELWRQNPIESSGGYSSQDARNPGGMGWFSQTADTFTASATTTVTGVEFWGGFGQITPGTVHGFTVRFYAEGPTALLPGPLLYERDFVSFTQSPDYTGLEGSRYRYTVALSPALEAPPGDYWISLVAHVDRGGTATDPQWYWTPALSGSAPTALQWFLVPNAWLPQPTDAAFVLTGTVCYANCDGSTAPPALNVADFTCFLQKYAGGEPYANCDGSTAAPSLNVADFTCFLQKYATGCP